MAVSKAIFPRCTSAERYISTSNEIMDLNMNRDIPERDWKKLRSLKDTALNIACERIFHKISQVIESRGAESHKYYLKLWKLMNEEDKEISLMFDDLKRSTAIFKLAMWKKNGILSDEDFEELTEETQKRINIICNIDR
ncbi:MAG: hypothetical protein GY864_08885 [Desulfobacterales bacterium]|nr:hypothetical protein [Desulfobacterales bacterium]